MSSKFFFFFLFVVLSGRWTLGCNWFTHIKHTRSWIAEDGFGLQLDLLYLLFPVSQPHLYALYRDTKHGPSRIFDRVNENDYTALSPS